MDRIDRVSAAAVTEASKGLLQRRPFAMTATPVEHS